MATFVRDFQGRALSQGMPRKLCSPSQPTQARTRDRSTHVGGQCVEVPISGSIKLQQEVILEETRQSLIPTTSFKKKSIQKPITVLTGWIIFFYLF